jgi:CHASE3 domain sensor protein
MDPSPNSSAPASEMGNAILVAGLSLVVAAAVLLVTAERDLRKAHAAVQQTNAALLQLADINSLVIGVDYSARGYALTGERLFRDHENEKQRDLKAGVEILASLTDSTRSAEIARLSRLIDRHAAVYAGIVAQGPGRAKEMAALITDPAERQKRYDALDAVKHLHGVLLADLNSHQVTAQKKQRYTLILTFVIVATAFLGAALDVIVKTVGRRRNRSGRLPAIEG